MLDFIMERATGLEPATYSLGSYFRVNKINTFLVICHMLATSNFKHTRYDAMRLVNTFGFLHSDEMAIDIQRHRGILMPHALLDCF